MANAARQKEVAKIVHCGANHGSRCTLWVLTVRHSRYGLTGRLGRFSQLPEETEHFCGWRQQKVAKIVQCGEQLSLKIQKGRPPRWP
jgi:hypothetical protein